MLTNKADLSLASSLKAPTASNSATDGAVLAVFWNLGANESVWMIPPAWSVTFSQIVGGVNGQVEGKIAVWYLKFSMLPPKNSRWQQERQ